MKTNRLIITAFILVALAQLFVPYQMISKQAGFAETGTEFKFRTDNRFNPDFNEIRTDLSGESIRLKFREDHLKISDKRYWEKVQNAYVIFTRDSDGFAKIRSVVTIKPADTFDWVRARVNVNWKDSARLELFYPFTNYYIQDTKNKKVESAIKNGLCDTLKTNYLKIKIKENQFVTGDLVIDGVPFKEMIRETKENQ